MHGETALITPERVRLVQELRDRGVLQSIASHNTLNGVMGVITKYQLEDCFLVPQAHLEEGVSKSFMIKTIMEELGIARASDVVFVDDQSFNVEEVAAAFPTMICIKPPSLHDAVDVFFTKDVYNEDDRNRVRRYRSEQDQKRAAVEYKGNYLDFLRTCEMTAEVRVPTEEEMPRVIDLVRRANQLAIVAVDDIPDTEFMEKREHIRGCWCRDKYGDNGLVGVAMDVNHVIPIFVVSCRMQGKGIGSYLLGSVINDHVGETVAAIWRPTEYNKSMLQMLEFFGFSELAPSPISKNTIYSLKVDEKKTLPDWIKPYES